MSANDPLRTLGSRATKMAMRQRPKKRRKMHPPAKQEGFNSYVRKITPFALLCFPFWLALPFIVDSDRIAPFLSGTVPWKLLLWLIFVLLMSFLFSAYSDWDDRRKAAKAGRR